MLGGSALATTENLEFLRRRVSQLGFWGCVMGLFFLAVRILVAANPAPHGQASSELGIWGAHITGTCCFGLTWLLTRRTTRSAKFIQVVEVVGVVGSCMAYAAMGLFMPAAWRPDWIVVLSLTNGTVIRAVIVPSTARRTFIVGLVLAVPVLVVSYVHSPAVGSAWAPVLERMSGAPFDPESHRRASLLWAAAWWAAATGICTVISHVIYGLRRQVSRAMQLGQYTLEEKLGEGGVGAVYRAHHAMLRRPTAVKILQPGRSRNIDLLRFEREVQRTAQLTHPNTVTVFDYGRTPEGQFYYAMELLDGASLAEVLDVDGPQATGRVIRILSQVSGALAEAHGVGLIHRDIKPANIILTEQGGVPDVVKVVDFGLVKESGTPRDAAVTGENTILGTPLYMSPEAIRDPNGVDARSDLYAVGVVGYALLTGTDVFEGATMLVLCGHHLHTVPEPLSERVGKQVYAPLEELIMRCLSKDPDERPAGALDMQRALELMSREHPWTVEQARAWWEEFRPAIEFRRKEQKEQEEGMSDGHAKQVTRMLTPPD
jgi:eukaryotic-like serine/threonine-protein kinase